MSLNSCLAKGPDCYMNNLIGILLRWREEQVALIGDIRKMFHSIHLKPLKQHCHRFLQRNLEIDREPDVYVMTRVNMGDTPAPAFSTEAVYKTADMFETESPKAANLLKRSSYVDDLINSQPSTLEALKIVMKRRTCLQKGGLRSSVGSLLESQVLARTKCCLPTVTRLLYLMVLQVRTQTC